jgi:hypothetical protein
MSGSFETVAEAVHELVGSLKDLTADPGKIKFDTEGFPSIDSMDPSSRTGGVEG